MSLVFVYGTLMRGGCRFPALAAEKFVSLAKTEPRYQLFDCGTFPGMVEVEEGVAIEGELWRVSDACLGRLDEIEGVPAGQYERRSVSLVSPRCKETVEAYFYCRDVSGLRDVGNRWVHR